MTTLPSTPLAVSCQSEAYTIFVDPGEDLTTELLQRSPRMLVSSDRANGVLVNGLQLRIIFDLSL